MKYVPLLTGILVPISLFLNIQSISVPLHTDRTEAKVIYVFSVLSLLFGALATVSLFIRMLERKIKWTTRLVMIGSWSSGLIGGLSLVLFYVIKKVHDISYNEAVVYLMLASATSLIAASMITYQIHLNEQHHQLYAWTLYHLSLVQRQFIILAISSVGYISIVSFIYTRIEKWPFEFALYWSIVSFTTIGFGDYSPKTVTGMVLVPPLTFFGIGLIGTTMWSLRNVFLEFLALRLASEYNKAFVENVVYEVPIPSTDDIPTMGRPPRPKPVQKQRKAVSGLFLETDMMSHSLPSSMQAPRSRSSSPPRLMDDRDDLPHHVPLRHHSYSEGGPPVDSHRTMTISRSSRLPSLTIVGNEALKEHHIEMATVKIIKKQAMYSFAIVMVNIVVSGIVFAYLEGWTVWEGFYFAYCSFTTIGILNSLGYGDYVVRTYLGRSLFIWFIFIAISSSTYLVSMISELAMNEWTVTTDTISKRVDRYETKAKWKRMYQNPHSEEPSEIEPTHPATMVHIPQEPSGMRISNPSPRAYSVSITRSMNALYTVDEEQRPLMESPVSETD
jgi:potassium channel subfamily K